MKTSQIDLFAGIIKRTQMTDSFRFFKESILEYGPRFDHWCSAYSMGKDSSSSTTHLAWLIKTGQVPAPKSYTVMRADTRLELTPLSIAAESIIEELEEMGIEVRTVMAPIEKRFMTYILGRGVPPPNNNTFRWCTRQIKIDPMKRELEMLFHDKNYEEAEFCCSECGHPSTSLNQPCEVCHSVKIITTKVCREIFGESYWNNFNSGKKPEIKKADGQKILMITGVRQGESAIRDNRIVMSCGRDGAECGQGWYQESLPGAICDTLAPMLTWRVCHVWEWLKHWAPLPEFGEFSTKMIADAYGGDEAEEINARTGCIGCPLASKDKALDNLIIQPNWAYLAPLKRIKQLWVKLREPQNRLRKTGKNSSEKNKQRMGPLTMAARKMAFNEIMRIQSEVNERAILEGKPIINILNVEEQLFIQQCWKDNVWPNRWDGDEPTGDTIMDTVYFDGSVQPFLDFGN